MNTSKVIEDIAKISGYDPEDVIRALVKHEQELDSGKTQYVMVAGERLAIAPEIMEEYGIKSGQTVGPSLFHVLIQKMCALVSAKVELEKFKRPKHSDDCRNFGIKAGCAACARSNKRETKRND